MNKKIRFITETALMLALLVSLQALTKGFGQLVTGSCVNAILAVSVLVGGLGSGITVALVSPVLAFVLGIAPQILTVPAIMAGNTVYVVVLYLLADREGFRLGYGGGYYDRWLAGYEGFTAMVCPADRLVDSLPHEEFDRPVDLVLTDKE